MNSKIVAAVAVIGALSLAACDNGPGRRANTGICTNFKAGSITNSTPAPVALSDGATPVDDCVRRWSYSLASASDPADVVAEAVVVACGAVVSRWNQASLSRPLNGEGISLATGLPSNPLAEHGTFAQGRAVFYVVQARAGQCAPPDVTNGIPVGTSPI
jgi:hypothetical protein